MNFSAAAAEGHIKDAHAALGAALHRLPGEPALADVFDAVDLAQRFLDTALRSKALIRQVAAERDALQDYV